MTITIYLHSSATCICEWAASDLRFGHRQALNKHLTEISAWLFHIDHQALSVIVASFIVTKKICR